MILSLQATAQKQEEMKTIRLLYPQWQGAHIEDLAMVPELGSLKEASQGYVLGSQLLQLLAPDNPNQETVTVPVSMKFERKVVDGVADRDILAEQQRAAHGLLRQANPDRVITLGGDCSVSVVPFTYMAERYKDDVAVLWVDAHPDINLPGDVYDGYHAMAVTAMMGKGDKKLLADLPAFIAPKDILFVGLRDWDREQIKERQKEYGMTHVTVDDVRANSDKVLAWLKQTGKSHVVIHFDLDVLEPSEIIPALGSVPDGMKMREVVRLINDVAAQYDVASLTIAEPVPRRAIQIRSMLDGIGLFK